MKLKTTLFAAAATIAIAPAAHAEGLYGAIGAGLSYMADDIDFDTSFGSPAFDADIDYNKGVGVYATLGKHLGNGMRGEFEFSYRDHDVRHIPGDGLGFPGFPSMDGSAQSMSFMLNAIKDFDNGSSFTPYVGLGAGAARTKLAMNGANTTTSSLSPISIDDKELVFAYQGIAGIAVELAENLVLDVSYRYHRTEDVVYDGAFAGSAAGFDTHLESHNVFAGLRWNFGATAAPVQAVAEYKDCWDGSSVPVSASCPEQIMDDQAVDLDPVAFTVYFDYDKSNLTPEASNLVREAASRAMANDIETVVVTGNTDTSGGAAYNERLSARRAAVVRDALIANGVSADRIRTEALGETNLAKPTPDGTREPLNRRTDVTISFE